MLGTRLALADGLHALDDVLVYHPDASADLSAFASAKIVQPFRPDYDHWHSRGRVVAAEPEGQASLGIVCLPRSKTEARHLIADASERCEIVAVDGQNTQGIQSVLKAVRARVEPIGVVSKAKGKLFWFEGGDFADWIERPNRTDGGFWTAPGVFSADAVDAGSALLAEALPTDLNGTAIDLGAGWGYLSAHLLTRDLDALHLVEAHHMALECARRNVTDRRAVFHWADARVWQAPARADIVVMNPPFHAGSRANPGLGQAFIDAAARLLSPRGVLWMVANRHLPYEASLQARFRKTVDIGGTAGFKVICAEGPRKER